VLLIQDLGILAIANVSDMLKYQLYFR